MDPIPSQETPFNEVSVPLEPESPQATVLHDSLDPPASTESRAKDLVVSVNQELSLSNQHCLQTISVESEVCGEHAGDWLLSTPDVQNLEVNLLDFSNDDIAGPIEEETLVVPSTQPSESRPCVDECLRVSSPLPIPGCGEWLGTHCQDSLVSSELPDSSWDGTQSLCTVPGPRSGSPVSILDFSFDSSSFPGPSVFVTSESGGEGFGREVQFGFVPTGWGYGHDSYMDVYPCDHPHCLLYCSAERCSPRCLEEPVVPYYPKAPRTKRQRIDDPRFAAFDAPRSPSPSFSGPHTPSPCHHRSVQLPSTGNDVANGCTDSTANAPAGPETLDPLSPVSAVAGDFSVVVRIGGVDPKESAGGIGSGLPVLAGVKTVPLVITRPAVALSSQAVEAPATPTVASPVPRFRTAFLQSLFLERSRRPRGRLVGIRTAAVSGYGSDDESDEYEVTISAKAGLRPVRRPVRRGDGTFAYLHRTASTSASGMKRPGSQERRRAAANHALGSFGFNTSPVQSIWSYGNSDKLTTELATSSDLAVEFADPDCDVSYVPDVLAHSVSGKGAPFSSPSPSTSPGGLRRCVHCKATKTPQWRVGPAGPKTLCNACGVRFKKGKLCAEYRPANSPEYEEAKHSHIHRKILERRYVAIAAGAS